MARTLNLCRPGLVDYALACEAQRALVGRAAAAPPAERQDWLLLLQHPPVITIGRRGSRAHVLAAEGRLAEEGVQLAETNRGGDVTYHGPGQVVGYPVFDLARHGRDVHRHMRRLEEAVIGALAAFGVEGFRREGLTGVWTQGGKIAAIGIAVSHWIAYHGFALNVAPNMAHFGLIVPCGLQGVRVASLESETGRAPAIAEVEAEIAAQFCAVFGFDAVEESGALPVFEEVA